MPVHPPEAVHVVELVEDQVSVLLPPLPTNVGLALRVTVGSSATDTLEVAPPQLMVYVAAVLIGPTLSEPDVLFVPLQPPLALHELALDEFQVSVTAPPVATAVELAVSDAVGVGVELAPLFPPPPPPQPVNVPSNRIPATRANL